MRARALFLLIAPVLIGSCSERSDFNPTEPPASFGFTNGPSEPGNSGIFRSEDGFFAVISDFNAGLVAIIGLQNTLADLCNGEGEFDLAAIQIKPHELGEVNSLITMRDAHIQVLALPEGTQNLCALAGAPVLYSGTGSLQRADNNFTEFGTEGGRANSFGWSAQGVLSDLVNGGEVRFSGVRRFLINPQTNELRQVVSTVTITR